MIPRRAVFRHIFAGLAVIDFIENRGDLNVLGILIASIIQRS